MLIRTKRQYSNAAFSLTETLLAVGTLAVGMIFIGGTFLAGIYFTTIATERTIAAVAADEAFAKIKLYATGDPFDPNDDIDVSRLDMNGLKYFTDAFVPPVNIDAREFTYPSTDIDAAQKQYHWSALCRRESWNPTAGLVQVTVFVSRKVGAAARYWVRDSNNWPAPAVFLYPRPVSVNVVHDPNRPTELLIIDAIPGDSIDERAFINDGYRIVDNRTGHIYRVLQRYVDRPDAIEIDGFWQGGVAGSVWVIPPPVGGGKDPCIAIYQKVLRF